MLDRPSRFHRHPALPFRPLAALLVGLAPAACYDQAPVPGNERGDGIEIVNDEAVLEQRVAYPERDVPIDPAGGSPPPTVGPATAPPTVSSVALTLRTEAAPPVVQGVALQAISVWQPSGTRAIVSYGVAGQTAMGGLDLFQLVGNGPPRLRSSAMLEGTDVFAVAMDTFSVYAGEASLADTLDTPALLRSLLLEGNKLTLEGGLQRSMPSFAVTSVAGDGTTVYVTTGDAGGVYALDPVTLALRGEYALDDARWVALDPTGDRVVVAQGQPGRLSVFRAGSFPGGSMELIATWSFPGADVAESKTTVEVHGGKAFVAAGTAGVQVVCLDDGSIVGTVPRPDPEEVGLDPSVVVTNAVTVEDELMFISNGEAGVYAAGSDGSLEADGCGPLTLDVLGRLRFDDLESANHVAIRGRQLYVAAGRGGIKVVDVRTR